MTMFQFIAENPCWTVILLIILFVGMVSLIEATKP